MQWTRSRNRPCSQTPAGLVCEAGLRMWPRWQESRPIYPRSQCAWQKCSDAAFAVPFLLILIARRAYFPAQEHAFPSQWPFWSYWAVHNPTVVIAFSHSVDGVSSPVRDHSGLARVLLRTDPSVLTRSVYFEQGGQTPWTRSRDSLGSRTDAPGLVRQSGPKIRP
jgi:hypothetical protein